MAVAQADAPSEMRRMTLKQDEYLSEFGGRHPAGSAVIVPSDVADRWERFGIASVSKKTDKSALEMRKAELLAQLEALESEADPYASAMTAESLYYQPRPMRNARRQSAAAARREALIGAETVNAPEIDDDSADDEGERA